MKIVLFTNTSWNIFNYRINLIEALESEGHEVVLLAPEDEYTQYLIDEGYHWKCFPISRKGMNPLQELKVIHQLMKIYINIRPDIVFQFTPKCVLYGSLVAKMIGIPTIVNTITGLGFLFSGSRVKYPLIREIIRIWYYFSLNKTSVIFQNSDNMTSFINQKIVSSEQSFLIHGSGVDIGLFTPMEENEGVPVVLFPARLIKEKGIFDFVEAAEILQRKNINARFVIVGRIDKGNPSAISEKEIESWVNNGIVEWWGWRSDMFEVFHDVHIVCLPTYYHEGTPKTLIEAASSGKPIIASDAPGCREIVFDNKNGLLIQPKDSQSLADAIQLLLENSELRVQMGTFGRKLVEEKFQDDVVVGKIMNVVGLISSS